MHGARVIYAIEPERENFNLMMRNFAPLSDVFALRAGVWDRQSALAISDPTVESWSFSLEERNKNDNVDAVDVVAAVTIPEILDKVPDGACFIVKIDIEGGENQLFRSNSAWLDNAVLVIIEIHDWKFPWQATAASFFSAISRRKPIHANPLNSGARRYQNLVGATSKSHTRVLLPAIGPSRLKTSDLLPDWQFVICAATLSNARSIAQGRSPLQFLSESSVGVMVPNKPFVSPFGPAEKNNVSELEPAPPPNVKVHKPSIASGLL